MRISEQSFISDISHDNFRLGRSYMSSITVGFPKSQEIYPTFPFLKEIGFLESYLVIVLLLVFTGQCL